MPRCGGSVPPEGASENKAQEGARKVFIFLKTMFEPFSRDVGHLSANERWM